MCAVSPSGSILRQQAIIFAICCLCTWRIEWVYGCVAGQGVFLCRYVVAAHVPNVRGGVWKKTRKVVYALWVVG
jgi:hypothetical protein